MNFEGIEGRVGREGGARSSIRFDCFNSERFGGYWGGVREWEGNLDLALYLFFLSSSAPVLFHG